MSALADYVPPEMDSGLGQFLLCGEKAWEISAVLGAKNRVADTLVARLGNCCSGTIGRGVGLRRGDFEFAVHAGPHGVVYE